MPLSRISIPALLAAISMTMLSACTRPAVVGEGASIAGARLATLKAQAARQQQAMTQQRNNLAADVADAALRAGMFQEISDENIFIWQASGTDADKKNLEFMKLLRARDAEIVADPYVRIRGPKAVEVGSVAVDTSGLDAALAATGRLSGERAIDASDAAALTFDVIRKVELPEAETTEP